MKEKNIYLNLTNYDLLRKSIVRLILEFNKINDIRFNSIIKNDMLPGLNEMVDKLKSCYDDSKKELDNLSNKSHCIEINRISFDELDKALDFTEFSFSVLRKGIEDMIFLFENRINEDKKLFKKIIFSLKDVRKNLLNTMRINAQAKELLNEN